MDDNIVLPPDISRAAREYFQRCKVVTEKFIAKFNMKPFSWETIEARNQMREELMKVAASCPPGIGTCSDGSREPPEIHRYKGFIIAIYTIQLVNGQYSTVSGIRKAGAPIPQEPLPLSEEKFPTHEAAAKAALEE